MGKAKRLKRLNKTNNAKSISAKPLAGFTAPLSKLNLSSAADLIGLMETNDRDETPASELDDTRVMELLGATKPGSIFCEDCDDELTNVVEVDIDEKGSFVALFVAKCPKCETLSSQPCFTTDAANRMRTWVIELNGTTAEQHTKFSPDSLVDL